MSFLRMKGVRCASLEEFRENFDFTNAKDYLRQGRLSVWFREIGESAIANELDELKDCEYSDQTLLDNFIGIFRLEGEKARLPEVEVPLSEEEPLPAVCEVTVNPKAALRNVKDSMEGPYQYLKNKVVLKIILDIVLDNLPKDSIEITEDSEFVKDLKFGKTQLDMLAQRLNEKLDVSSISHSLFGSLESCIIARVPNIRFTSTVGGLLDIISYNSSVYCLRSYINDETIHLLDGGF